MSLRRATRPARHALAYAGLRAFVGLLRRLPLAWSLALGAALGRSRRGRPRAPRHTAHGGPARPARRAAHGIRLLGRSGPPRAAELACADRALPRVALTPEARALVDATMGPALVATAHLGNWELMAAAFARAGLPFAAIAARLQSGPLFAWLARTRARLGVPTLTPGGGARAAVRHLRAGRHVALFVDQATGERGRPLPFLGRPAPTPGTFERLLAATGATPLFAWTVRGPDGAHAVHLERVPTDGPPLDWLTARVEALVRAHPTQWVWLHDRWRADPGRR
ncbi:MAG: lysophospholipid acyltransferase family protein [Myxococcales bacterium]|nr:lysophospholipid acyltransferase family protein [Myxococcales bacterium]